MNTVELTVMKVERGDLTGVNTGKALVQASHEVTGTHLSYWTSLAEAPRVGTKLAVTVLGQEVGL